MVPQVVGSSPIRHPIKNLSLALGFLMIKLLLKDKIAKHSGLLEIALLWSGVGISMHLAGLGFVDTRPISYLGIDSRTSQLFSVSLITSSVLFIIFGNYIRTIYKIKNQFF